MRQGLFLQDGGTSLIKKIGMIIGLLLWLPLPLCAAPNTYSPLGINTNEVMDDDASIPFIDIFKTSLPFEEARPWLTKGNVEYDAYGWPKKLNGGQVGTRFLYKLPKNTVPEGHYTVLYDGEGKLEYSDDAKLVKREPGKDIISIKAGKDNEYRVKLLITHSNEDNYLRNIRVLLPGGVCSNNPYKRVSHKKQCRGSHFLSFEKHHEQLIFNPDYLNYMKDFKVLRFMNMSGITRNPISSWNDRPKLKNATWGGKATVRGAPVEIMVALANKLNADPWFNMPHKADSHFIRSFAQYVKDNLKPNLKAYVEYTNEAWNTIFTQAHYVKDMGERMKLDDDRDKAGYKYFSLRSVQIFNMWEQVFGGTQRIVRVMGSWTGYTRLSEMLLSYRDAYKKTDAIAIAPYFYPSKKSVLKAKSVSQIFKLLYDPKELYSIPKVLGYIHKNAEMAKKFGVDLIAYEGGQHLVDWKSRSTKTHPTKLMIAANRDWRMSRAYSVFMQGWKDNGGKLFVNFSAPRTYQWFGSWGTKEFITQSDSKAPKHRSLMQFKRKNPCWWSSCASSTIARLEKPSENPARNIFALVPDNKHTKKKRLAKAGTNSNSKKSANTNSAGKTTNTTGSNSSVVAKNATNKLKTVASAVRTAANTKQTGETVATNVAKSVVRTAFGKTVDKPSIKSNRSLSRTVMTNKTNKPKQNKKTPSGNAIWDKVAINNAPLNRNSTNTPVVPNTNKTPTSVAVIHRAKGRQLWNNRSAMRLANIVGGKIEGGQDLSATWQTHWDDNYLYIRVDALDDKFVRDSNRPWSDDSIEIYIDADGSRSAQYDGKNDFHFIYRWKDRSVNLSQNSPRRRNLGIQQTMTRTNGGYTLETAIPWKTLGVSPVAGHFIGIDVQINDDDNGRDRDGKLAWYAKTDKSWSNPQQFGKLKLGI